MFDLDMLNRCKKDPLICYGGGGKSPSVQTVAATPPPPPPSEEAMMVEAKLTPDKDAAKKKAITMGANSLQIPLGGMGSWSTIGTM